MNGNDPFQLQRFVEAQDKVHETVLQELSNGKKQSHWMWFIFPQLKSLGFSSTAKYYGISGMDEARAYLEHPLLRSRLEACVKAVLECGETDAGKIFGYPDNLKFHSSLTLFLLAQPGNKLFAAALHKFFNGIPDKRTEEMATRNP